METLSLYPKGFLLSFAAIISCLWVIYAVFIKKNFNKKIYKVYFFYALSFILWILSNAYFYSSLLNTFDKFYAVKMGLFANIVCIMGMIFAFYFSCLLRDNKEIKLWEKIFIFSVTLGNFALNLIPNLTVKDIKIFADGSFQLIQGDGILPFAVIAATTIILTFKNFFSLRKSKIKIKQIKVYYMLTGVSILITSIFIFDLFIPLFFKNYSYVWLPPLFCLAEIALFGYALLNELFYSKKHMFQKAFAYCANAAVYLMLLIVAVITCHNNPALKNPIAPILIYSTVILAHCIFNKRSFRFFDRLFNIIIYKNPLNKAQQIKETIKALPDSFDSINNWLIKLQDILEVKGAEFAYAGDASFNNLSEYFDGDYSGNIVKDTLDFKIAQCADKNGKRAKLTNLKNNMEKESVSLLVPIVNHQGEPAGILILKDKSAGGNFSYEELSELRILPEHAVRIVFKKENKEIITKDMLLALENRISSVIAAVNNAGLQEDIRYFSLIETYLDQLIIFIGIFSESMHYRANIIKTNKEPVKLSEIFDITMEGLGIDRYIDDSEDKIKIFFDINNNIKDKSFLLDKDLIAEAFYVIGANAVQFNNSAEKQLKIKAFIDDKKLILDFEDNGIGIKEENFEKIFEPLVAENTDYKCKECCKDIICADGVGLTYAKGAIEAHNGRIFVLKSKAGKTVIRVMLPVA